MKQIPEREVDVIRDAANSIAMQADAIAENKVPVENWHTHINLIIITANSLKNYRDPFTTKGE